LLYNSYGLLALSQKGVILRRARAKPRSEAS